MPAPRKYPFELRARAVREVRTSGRPIAHVAKDLGIWLTTAEREELRQLRRENAQLRRANEILKAASAFLRRTSTVPGRGRTGGAPSRGVIEHLRDKGLGVGQTGFAVAFGIVIASFVMAMFFTPALTTLFGRAAWWPRRIHPPAAHQSAPLPADQHAGPVQDSGSYAPWCSGSRRD